MLTGLVHKYEKVFFGQLSGPLLKHEWMRMALLDNCLRPIHLQTEMICYCFQPTCNLIRSCADLSGIPT